MALTNAMLKNMIKVATKKTTMVESGKQTPTKESSKKTRTMHAWVENVSALLIELDIGLNIGQCIC
jgi:hypothetical protein